MARHVHIHIGKKTADANDPISTQNKNEEEVKREKRDDLRVLSQVTQTLKNLSYFGRQNGCADIERAIDKLYDKVFARK